MTDDIDDEELPANLPACNCFQSGDDELTIMRCHSIANVAAMTMSTFIEAARQQVICNIAGPYLMEVTMLSMVISMAIGGTAIDPGSEDAERETFRVLDGLEERLKARAREGYDAVRKEMMEAAKVKGALN